MKWIVLAPLLLLGALLAIILLAMLLRVGAGVSYRGGKLRVWARIGVVNVTVYPRRKRSKRKRKRRGEKAPPSGMGKELRTAPARTAPRPDARRHEAPAEQFAADRKTPSVEEICAYARFGIDAGGQLLRGLRIDRLYFRADIGTPDAAKTALAYGSAAAAVSNLWPLAENLFDIRKKDIFINACFEREQTAIEGEIVITAMIGRMVFIGLRIFRQFIKMKKAVSANEQSQ